MKIDINNCTLQEAMDYAVQRMVEQGGRCGSRDRSGNFYCMYGNDEGKHCAVGWLLPKDDRELMAYKGVARALVCRYADRVPAVVRENVETMTYLQDFHDARYRGGRERRRKELSRLGIDTSGPHWQAWIDMGEGS